MSTPLNELHGQLQAFKQQLLHTEADSDLHASLDIILALSESAAASDVMVELEKLLSEVQASRTQFGAITSKHGDIVEANDELDAVLQTTETAANNIMDAVEEIQQVSESLGAQQEAVNDACTRIFEACNFQDLTGQRIRNVIKTLSHVEESITALLNGEAPPPPIQTSSEELTDEDLMNGPAKLGDEPTQDDIDKLFADN